MLYKLRDKVSVYEDNPELFTIPEFAKLYSSTNIVKEEDKDRRMRFVILVADRRSPLRSLPEKQRREKAALLCGYKMEGTRLDRNARELVAGNVDIVEEAITEYRKCQYDENQDTLDTINAQINEIKEYLKTDKATPMISNGKLVLDKNGKEIKVTDPKTLKIASELGEKLPGLVEAKQKLEALLKISVDHKPEITTYSSLDIPAENFEGDEELSTIDKFHMMNAKKE